MQHDVWCLCHAKWCDDVMLCNMIFTPKTHTHPCNKTHNLFKSALTFRCKPPLGASSPFTSAESAFIFRCKPPLGASSPFTFSGIRVDFSRFAFYLGGISVDFSLYALHSLWNDFGAENLHCAPFGTTFLWLRQTYYAFLRTTFCCFEEFSIVRRSSLLSQVFQQFKPVKKIYFPWRNQRN